MSYSNQTIESSNCLDDELEDWETTDITILPPQRRESIDDDLFVDINSTNSKEIEYECDVCNRLFSNSNSLSNHRRSCNVQEVAFYRLSKGKPIPKDKELREKMKKSRSLDRLWEWVNQVITLENTQEYGTDEFSGVYNHHSRLSHFVIWALSQYIIGNNVFDKISHKIESAVEYYSTSNWESQAATNKVIPFLNNLVKNKSGRSIEPIPYVGFLDQMKKTPERLKKRPQKSEEEVEMERVEENTKKDLGRSIITKGFTFNLHSHHSISYLEKYSELADIILRQESTFGLEALHISKHRTEFERIVANSNCGTDFSQKFDTPPYPEFSLSETELERAVNSSRSIIDFFRLYSEDTFSSGKDGLDMFFQKGMDIDGFVLFPFHQVIIEWLSDKKITSRVIETFKVKCNRLKKGTSLLCVMKQMGQIDRILNEL